jgi:hypothetical protein
MGKPYSRGLALKRGEVAGRMRGELLWLVIMVLGVGESGQNINMNTLGSAPGPPGTEETHDLVPCYI